MILLLAPFATVSAMAETDKVVTATPGDTSKELQALLDYNKNGDYNLTIKIPAGNYDLTSELRIYSNTTIIADPQAYLIKKHTKGAMIANDMKNDQGGYTTTTNITIQGGVWDSINIADQKGTESFRFIHATNVTIRNATVCNISEGHLITFAGVKNGIVDQCKVYGYHGTMLKEAIHLDIVHDDVLVPSMQSSFIKYDDLPCDGIQITNNEIYDYPRAIGSHSAVEGVYHKNITISSNNIHDIDEAGIKAYLYVNATIENNIINNTGLGILAYTYIDNEKDHYYAPLKTTVKEQTPSNYQIVIKNNEFKNIRFYTSGNNNLWGDAIRLIGSKKRPMTGTTIEGNKITSTKRYGIFLEQAPNTVVNKNIVTSTAKNAIYLINGCNKATVQGNTISKAGAPKSTEGGIGVLASNQVNVLENKISTAAKNGIFLYTGSKKCAIKRNTITTSGENGIGIYQQSNGTVVYLNTINDYGKNGIFVYEAGSASISNNKITAKAGSESSDAIHIQGDQSSSDAFSVKKNFITTSNRYGMYISGASKATISNNTIKNTAKHALYLDGKSNYCTISNNTIYNAGKAGSEEGGIGVSKSFKVTIVNNKVSKAAKNGIFLYNASKNCIIKSNTIQGAADNAISINHNSDKASITANTITGSTTSKRNNRGIFVYGANQATISKNVISSCKVKQGININNSTGSKAYSNTIKKELK